LDQFYTWFSYGKRIYMHWFSEEFCAWSHP
jgi:hypothetical protein